MFRNIGCLLDSKEALIPDQMCIAKLLEDKITTHLSEDEIGIASSTTDSFILEKKLIHLSSGGEQTGPLSLKLSDTFTSDVKAFQTRILFLLEEDSRKLTTFGIEQCLRWINMWCQVDQKQWPWEIAANLPKAPIGPSGSFVNREYPPRPLTLPLGSCLHRTDKLFLFNLLPNYATPDWCLTSKFVEVMNAADAFQITPLLKICHATIFELLHNVLNDTEDDYDPEKVIKVFGCILSDSEKRAWAEEQKELSIHHRPPISERSEKQKAREVF